MNYFNLVLAKPAFCFTLRTGELVLFIILSHTDKKGKKMIFMDGDGVRVRGGAGGRETIWMFIIL